ncbi:MAG TPA: Crp/Fnr family transcriptional regulator [Flavobacteriaceae bacterium]|nr:Crp/Fnr family transcriptional regulator [Flavobacteriaceae bacterium]HQU20820.1 Crp/Fnr family transcriptional regulator [Flavobacteriaceae bacterium]HQU64995.1 Crp/Fnr family transcriptional regulator [Flavobacteriaceae bacterium]HRW45228.1 Crp/Fnr family transcriptional regulator [Flavobacteriaceae bacterium]
MKASPQQLETYLKQVISDPKMDEAIKILMAYFKPLALQKNRFFVKEGAICKYFCYVSSGILQHFIEVNGEEKTTYLALKNTCTSALKSFREEIPSRKNIKALTDCELWVITHDDFESLMQLQPVFRTFYHNLIENQIYRIDDHRINLLTLSPEERYLKLLGNDPQMVREIPLKYLASFLGISIRHLSRIRKNAI